MSVLPVVHFGSLLVVKGGIDVCLLDLWTRKRQFEISKSRSFLIGSEAGFLGFFVLSFAVAASTVSTSPSLFLCCLEHN